MQHNKPKSLQQIYDFCKLNATYNEYYNIPDSFQCKDRRKYRYYHNDLNNRGQSRAGTYIYSQAMRQLDRFIGNQQKDFYFHVNEETFEKVDYQKFEGRSIYIVAHIERNGVLIEYTHPYKYSYENDRIWFTARSHDTLDKQGLVREVKKHFNNKMLFPPGRYRELQIQYKIPKEKFVDWYRHEYKWSQERKHEQEYWDMIEMYIPEPPKADWDDCYDMLRMAGAFDDFGCDSDLERYDMTDQFYNICNR